MILSTGLTPVHAAMIAAAVYLVFSPPASAGGSLSFNLTPQNEEQARKVRTGLGVLAYAAGAKGGASVRQNGKNNSAGLRQQGKGNLGFIYQEGKGHSATLDQKGNGNSYGIFQFGKKTDAAVTQRGNGKAGLIFQWGG